MATRKDLVRSARPHPRPDLCGDDHLVAPREFLQRSTDDFLAGPAGIDIRGVEEVDAKFERTLDNRPALLVVQRPRMGPAIGQPEGHAPETNARNLEARIAELDVVH